MTKYLLPLLTGGNFKRRYGARCGNERLRQMPEIPYVYLQFFGLGKFKFFLKEGIVCYERKVNGEGKKVVHFNSWDKSEMNWPFHDFKKYKAPRTFTFPSPSQGWPLFYVLLL
jgi:hypothetical protein